MNTLFKALNDQTRRDILELLKDKDMTAGDIADKFERFDICCTFGSTTGIVSSNERKMESEEVKFDLSVAEVESVSDKKDSGRGSSEFGEADRELSSVLGGDGFCP